MMSRSTPQMHQSSDWSSLPNRQSTNQITTQSKKESNKLSQCWSSLSPITRGILLGVLITCLPLVIVLSIWLAKPSAKTTITPVNAPVLRWNTAGITIAGVTGIASTASNNLQFPWSLALDWSNTLYITDRYNNRVQKFLINAKNGTTIAGQSNAIFGSMSNQLDQPTGIYVNSNGDVYISDTNNNRIQRWNNGDTFGRTVFGNGTIGNANNLLFNSYKISCDESSGTFYIADSYNHRIVRYENNAVSGNIIAGSNTAGTSPSQLSFPYGFHFDSSTNSLLIANAGTNNIVRWTIGASNWTLVAGSSAGLAGTTAVLFQAPTDILLDPMGNMYVVDMGNHRIQFFSSGQSSGVTIAGSTSLSGSNATLLYYPSSLALDNQLNLYVVDSVNHRVQKFIRY